MSDMTSDSRIPAPGTVRMQIPAVIMDSYNKTPLREGEMAFLDNSILGPLTPKALAVRELSEQLPFNDYGLPVCIYRADIIPGNYLDLTIQERADYADSATIELDYSQGFPTLPDGEPFWSVLPGESAEAHRAFIQYLDMPRQPAQDGRGNAGLATPVRQLHLLKTTVGRTTAELVNWATLYFWTSRTRAYDMFITASHNKQKEYRLQEVENQHYVLASHYIDLASAYITQVLQDPESHGLRPKDAMDLLHRMLQVQRLSLGVAPFSPANPRGSGEQMPQNASMEVILRTIAQNSGQLTGSGNGNTKDMTRQLFDDPEALEQAQELIIRLNTAKHPRKLNAMAPTRGFYAVDSDDSEENIIDRTVDIDASDDITE